MPAISLFTAVTVPVLTAVVGGGLGWWLANRRAATQQQAAIERTLSQEKALWQAQTEATTAALQNDKTRLTEEKESIAQQRAALAEKLSETEQLWHTDKTNFAAQSATLKTSLEKMEADIITLKGEETERFQKFLQSQGEVLKKSIEEKADREFGEKQKQFTEKMDLVVKPLQDSMKLVYEHVEKVDREHVKVNHNLHQKLDHLSGQTSHLSQSLKQNKGRGNWGEATLINLLKDSGFVEGQSYEKQESYASNKKRPDFRILLPDDRSVFVDSKALQLHMDAADETDASLDPAVAKEMRGQRYVKSLKDAVNLLASKQYQAELTEAANFVVLYVPIEGMLSLAIEEDPGIAEWARQQGVMLATPYNIMPMLHVIHQSWQYAKLNNDARLIAGLGQEVYDKVREAHKRMLKVRDRIGQLEEAYLSLETGMSGRQGVIKKAQALEEFGCDSGQPINDEEAKRKPLTFATVADDESKLLATSGID